MATLRISSSSSRRGLAVVPQVALPGFYVDVVEVDLDLLAKQRASTLASSSSSTSRSRPENRR